MGFKTIRQISKEIKKKEQDQEVKETELQKSFKKFFNSSIDCNAVQGQKFKKMKFDLKRFNEFLDNFKSNKELHKFLNELTKTEDISLFFKELKLAVPPTATYKKYLNWLNYNEYDKRHLVMAVYQKFYSTQPKRTSRVLEIKGITARQHKSEARKLKDEGTSKEYVHKRVIACSNVEKFVKWLGKTIGHRNIDRTTYGKVYGICKTYAYKMLKRGQGSYSEKQRQKRQIDLRAKRLDRFKESKETDITQIRDYISREFQVNILDVDNSELNKRITRIQQLLRRKFYKDFNKAITTGCNPAVQIGKKVRVVELKDMAEQFKDDLEKLKL